ncbi:glycine zipper family protein [Actinoplanes derwentensis]|uniref:Uncharacterized protein n=1 Tax=Actinoplanes derwentensis TaxID=113562 RepID=A0A1H2DE09_9ACTN|nr:glycine zipper family protein [Actinoplanes derwentensis]GID84830.1 hypothetical protein Ade03nite_37540 [Actinoplanes derwentensis]SDT80998.1 hypothetical protein SAMN04489716_9450 [Actinoplanes derwentensis]
MPRLHDTEMIHSDSAHLGSTPQVVATAADFATAERAVAQLIDGGVPAGRAVIVACGRQLAGRRPAARAARRGALSGLVVAVLIEHLLAWFDLIIPLADMTWSTLVAAGLGALIGAGLGLIGHEFAGEDGPPVVLPGHYDVLVAGDVADHAVRLLGAERV